MFLSLVQFCLFSKAPAVLAARCMDLRDSRPEPLNAAVFISSSCSSIAVICTCSLSPRWPFSGFFCLSGREAVIAWYQSVAHYHQESVPCCMPEGFIGFKWKLWEQNKRWAVRKTSAVAAVSASDWDAAETNHPHEKRWRGVRRNVRRTTEEEN